jgi:hypothetical protein
MSYNSDGSASNSTGNEPAGSLTPQKFCPLKPAQALVRRS